jgi:hypothetical protein
MNRDYIGLPCARPLDVCEWNASLDLAGMVRAIAGVLGVCSFVEDNAVNARSQTRMALDGNITGESKPSDVQSGIPIFSLGVLLLAYAMTILP